MCFGGSSTPKPPPPPRPPNEQNAQNTSLAAEAAEADRLRRRGQLSTLLTGPDGAPNTRAKGKTLLGS